MLRPLQHVERVSSTGQSWEQSLHPGGCQAREAPRTAPVSRLLPLELHTGWKPPS